jgi:hypothetical protein
VGKRELKRRQMAELVERWRASGLTAEGFSRREKVPTSRLWYWKRRIGKATAPPGFLPLQILPDERVEAPATFELTFADGRRLLIPAALTGRPLRQLLSTLRSC